MPAEAKERASDDLEVELEMALSCHVGARNQPYFLQEQPAVLTTEPFLQSPHWGFLRAGFGIVWLTPLSRSLWCEEDSDDKWQMPVCEENLRERQGSLWDRSRAMKGKKGTVVGMAV